MSQKQEVNSGALYEIDVLGDKTKFLQYNVKTITVLKSIITYCCSHDQDNYKKFSIFHLSGLIVISPIKIKANI